MPRILCVANKLLSLRGNICITDTDDTIVYQARGELALFGPTWRVFEGAETDGLPNATIRRRVFAWAPTWDINVGTETFQIKRKLFSFGRHYIVVGGQYDGAVIRGNIWDLDFTITHRATLLAVSAGRLLSLRDRRSVEMASDEGEWFIAIAMLVLQIDRRSEQMEAQEHI